MSDRSSDALPGSSWGIHCHEDGCVETLTLSRTTTVRPTHEDDYQHLCPALDEAAVSLGWCLRGCFWWCPTHSAERSDT